MLCVFIPQAYTAKYYVAPISSGNTNGSSWVNASASLKTILDAAVAGDTVWVASGTYKPTDTLNRLLSFNIKDGVKVFGGFSGTETNLIQRDIIANKTILSGNIGIETDSTDNSSTVVNFNKCSANTELDGFTVSNGQSITPSITINSPTSLIGNINVGSASFGPKVFSLTGDVVLAEPNIACADITNNVTGKIVLIQRGTCTFKSKALKAQTAGAIGVIIYNNTTGDVTDPMGDDANISQEITIPVVSLSLATGTVIRNALTTNTVNISITKALSTVGGAALNVINSTCKIKNCILKNNYSTKSAVLCDSTSTPTFSNCTFDRNKSTIYGGAVYNIVSGSIFLNCNFTNNQSSYGGAVYNEISAAVFTNCTFQNNSSIYSGGAVFNLILQNSFKNCSFITNRANYGGAIYNQNSPLILDSCYFTNNVVTQTGGAIYQNTSNSTITNCIFDANQSVYAGAIYNDINSSTNIYKTTFYNNSASTGGAIYSKMNTTISNSLFELNKSINSGAAIMYVGGTNTLNNTIIIRNSSDGGTVGSGGGIQLNDSLAVVNVNNCLIVNNQAKGTADDGGGAIMIYGGVLNLKNSTIAQNSSATQGGAIRIKDNKGNAYIENTIIWGNTATVAGTEQLYNTGGKDSVSYSIVQGTPVYPGIGNLNSNPLFVNTANETGDDHNYLTEDDGFALMVSSPAINNGNPASNLLPTDIRGFARVRNYDMGAYEYQITTGMQTETKSNQLIYPNPATHSIYVNADVCASVINIYNLSGVLELTQQIDGKSEIDISGLNQGVYVLKVNDKVIKLIKK